MDVQTSKYAPGIRPGQAVQDLTTFCVFCIFRMVRLLKVINRVETLKSLKFMADGIVNNCVALLITYAFGVFFYLLLETTLMVWTSPIWKAL